MGDTREYLEFNGGPGRTWCEKTQTWIITGSCTDCDHGEECLPWQPDAPEPY